MGTLVAPEVLSPTALPPVNFLWLLIEVYVYAFEVAIITIACYECRIRWRGLIL